MNIIKKIKSSNKGFTLIELIVTLVLLGIVLPMLTSAFAESATVFMSIKRISDAEILSTNIERAITRELSVAASYNILPGGAAITFEKAGVGIVTVKTKEIELDEDTANTVLCINDEAVYDPKVYEGVNVAVKFENLSEAIKITVTYSGKYTAERNFTVKPLIKG